MNILIPYHNGLIADHFGRCSSCKIYMLEEDTVLCAYVCENEGALMDILKTEQIHVIICNHINKGVRQTLSDTGIRIFPGAEGDADAKIAEYMNGMLDFNPQINCEAPCSNCSDRL